MLEDDDNDNDEDDTDDDDKLRWCSALNFEHLQPTSSICQLFLHCSFELRTNKNHSDVRETNTNTNINTSEL